MVSIKSKKSWVIRNCHWQLKSLGFGFKISPRQHIRNWHCFPSSIVCVLLSSSLPVAINFLVFPSIGIPPSPLFFVLLSLTSTLMGRGKKLQPWALGVFPINNYGKLQKPSGNLPKDLLHFCCFILRVPIFGKNVFAVIWRGSKAQGKYGTQYLLTATFGRGPSWPQKKDSQPMLSLMTRLVWEI